MPTLVTSYHSGELDGTYILPPVKYPDGNSTSKNPTKCCIYKHLGHYYLKLGHHDVFERELVTREEVDKWYKAGTGDPEAVDQLDRFIRSLIRGLEVETVSGGCCVTSKTKVLKQLKNRCGSTFIIQ